MSMVYEHHLFIGLSFIGFYIIRENWLFFFKVLWFELHILWRRNLTPGASNDLSKAPHTVSRRVWIRTWVLFCLLQKILKNCYLVQESKGIWRGIRQIQCLQRPNNPNQRCPLISSLVLLNEESQLSISLFWDVSLLHTLLIVDDINHVAFSIHEIKTCTSI